MQTFGTIPVSWNMDDFKNLIYKFDPDPAISEEYASVGHSLESMKFYNCFENNIPFTLDNIRKHFNFLSSVKLAVNLFTPGQYIPLHSDKYERYIKINQVVEPSSITRIVLMLEDSVPGQFLQIENNVYSSWTAGDWFSWKYSATHAFYNLSKKNRYSLQITGLLNDQYTQ
jgi:hypothetical protein